MPQCEICPRSFIDTDGGLMELTFHKIIHHGVQVNDDITNCVVCEEPISLEAAREKNQCPKCHIIFTDVEQFQMFGMHNHDV